MAAEIELKLTLPNPPQPPLAQHPLVQRYQQGAPQQQALYNRYYDTPEQALNHHAIALRVRRQGQAFIQTLKTRGVSQGGLHQRQEWEWTLPSAQLDLTLLPPAALPAGLDPARLDSAFTTDFQRTSWQLCYPHGGQTALIELVQDEGWVSDGMRRDPLCELELELKQGQPDALLAFAGELAATVALRICRISKAERGYRLGAPERARQLPALPTVAPACSQRDGFYLLFEALLERLQSAIEGYEFLADSALLPALAEDFERLQQLVDRFAAALDPPDLGARLASQGRELRRLLAPLLLGRWSGAALPADAPLAAELAGWLNSRALGQLLLAASALLQRRPWHAAAAPFLDPGA